MKWKLLELLVCPDCRCELECKKDHVEGDDIVTGNLSCATCSKIYPIINSIPRFVPQSNYSASFGFQWNLYKQTQVDCFSGLTSSRDRFLSETGWEIDKLQDQWILDAGCGNGRFVEIASRGQAEVVGVDLSNAIDAAQDLFKDRKNVHLVQASILNLPFRSSVFDKCYCIGVIQHTPDPEKVIRELPKILKQNGELALTIYEKRKFTLFNSKYLLRPFTKRINKKALIFYIKCVAPVLFPLTEILFRLPKLGKIFKLFIPFANYTNQSSFTWRQRYEWAILDTFDMLSPAYDFPQVQSDVEKYLQQAGMSDLKRLSNPGINITGIKFRQTI